MKKRKIAIIAIPATIVGIVAALFAANQMKRTIPAGVKAVAGFDATKYLGTWYEIARLDYKWERGFTHVTATYSQNADGSIRVDNKGFDTSKRKWRNAIGKAKFVRSPDTAMLKVSFFGPFYAGYNVAAIDSEYRYALVMGRNRDYLWLLSRDKTMPEPIAQSYLRQARESGYDISKIIWTQQQ